ncbi:MAG: hypothetical protein OES57_00400 [Acidimicrobiia bacterium]|nr:hypothetical protein [Acidimicrobiia bacterium]
MTGQPADGFCPLTVPRGWGRSTTVRLPMTDAVFERWHRRSTLRVRAGLGAGFCLVGAAVTVRFPTIALLFMVLAFGLGVAWFVASWSLPATTPGTRVDGDRLVLTGVHDGFAASL